jgi:hypothetical protein
MLTGTPIEGEGEEVLQLQEKKQGMHLLVHNEIMSILYTRSLYRYITVFFSSNTLYTVSTQVAALLLILV